ncbi:MAG: hypothetical protein ACLP1Q_20355 [Solirubrobacteraceae bacterium]
MTPGATTAAPARPRPTRDDRANTIAAATTAASRVEAAVLALLLAHDRPWRLSDLQRALQPTGPAASAPVVAAAAATLRADGLLTDWQRPWLHDRKTTAADASDRRFVRASWAAVRAAELLAAAPSGGAGAAPSTNV